MNQREPTAAPLGAGQALPCLALLLLLLMAVARAWSRPTQPSRPALVQEVPYLVALGAPPLRFLEPAPPPDLVSRPPAAAPPHPAATDDTTTPSSEPAAQTASVPSTTATLPPAIQPPADSTPASEAEASASAPTRMPQPILTDEVRPQARPEDFLPFFQIPNTQPGDPTVIVPVPRASTPTTPLPPSSATYTQTPR